MTLKALYRYSKNGPDLMQYFRVMRVDGSTVYLGTDNQLYYEKLQYPEKIQVLERVLYEVHRTRLYIKVIMVGPDEMSDQALSMPPGLDPNDPLLSEASSMGAQITPTEKRKKE